MAGVSGGFTEEVTSEMDWVGGLGQKRVGEYFMHLQFQYGNLFVRCGVGVQMHSFAHGYPVI